MTAERTQELCALLANAAIYDLSHPLEVQIPVSGNHPGFRMALIRRHGDMVRADGGSAANEMMVMGGHTGTHLDALCHVSHKGKLFGNEDAASAQYAVAASQCMALKRSLPCSAAVSCSIFPRSWMSRYSSLVCPLPTPAHLRCRRSSGHRGSRWRCGAHPIWLGNLLEGAGILSGSRYGRTWSG